MKVESELMKKLEKIVEEQSKLVETEIMPSWARKFGDWLVVHPWRVVVPMAMLAYGVWRMAYGEVVREWVLKWFGGF